MGEDFGDDSNGIGKGIVTGKDRDQGTLSQSAVADFAPARRADTANFAGGVRSGVVVMNVALAVFASHTLDQLLKRGRAQRYDRENLSVAALKDSRAVSTGKESDIDIDRADLSDFAAIRADAFFKDVGADDLAHCFFEEISELSWSSALFE